MMLLRGLYTFEPRPEDHNHTLPFSHNDNLLFLDVLKRDSEWLRVADILGRVGYIPKSHVEPDDDFANPNLIQAFLVDAVVKARYYEFPSVSHLERLRDHVRENPSMVHQRAIEMRNAFLDPRGNSISARRSTSDQLLNSKRFQRKIKPEGTGPHELRRVGSESELDIGVKPSNQSVTSRPPKPPRNVETEDDLYISDSSVKTAKEGQLLPHYSTPCRSYATPSPSLQAIKSSLVNVVQETSGLDPIISENILHEVFQCMKDSTSKIPVPVESLLEKLTLSSISSPAPSPAITGLEKAMVSLAKLSRAGIKSGGRQPSTLQASEHQNLIEKLDKLRKSLFDCDAIHATQLLQLGQHSFSQDFAHLYNLESPISLKERMLDIFLIILTLDKKGRAPLLSSPLPIHLARDLMAQTGTQLGERKLFLQIVNVLVILLSCGEPMPDLHFQILGTGLVNFILTEIEAIFTKEGKDDIQDQITDDRFPSMVNLVLVYNLQFAHPSRENLLLKVLAEGRKRPRGFFAVLMKLFKKAHEPHHQSEGQSHPGPHSVFKMLSDICLCQRTACQLTTSDKKKLLQIITDGLLSSPAGSGRLGYAIVLKALLPSLHSSFSLGDVKNALISIFLDSDPLAVREQQLIRLMSIEFPGLFLKGISKARMNLGGESSQAGRREGGDESDDSYLSS